jgi:hypothetical protein
MANHDVTHSEPFVQLALGAACEEASPPEIGYRTISKNHLAMVADSNNFTAFSFKILVIIMMFFCHTLSCRHRYGIFIITGE